VEALELGSDEVVHGRRWELVELFGCVEEVVLKVGLDAVVWVDNVDGSRGVHPLWTRWEAADVAGRRGGCLVGLVLVWLFRDELRASICVRCLAS
jgi:hypothetical protein